jgi:hypothetical protein
MISNFNSSIKHKHNTPETHHVVIISNKIEGAACRGSSHWRAPADGASKDDAALNAALAGSTAVASKTPNEAAQGGEPGMLVRLLSASERLACSKRIL